MGNSPLTFENNEYNYYSTQIHPIQGQVDVYRVEGDGGYVMRKMNIQSDEVISLSNNVQKLHSPFLIRYYGHKVPETSTFCTQIIKSISVTTYWEYLNHDLFRDTQLNKSTLKEEKKVWLIMQSCCQGGKILFENGLAFQYNQYNIQFSPQKTIKLYWANLEKANMHRSYYRYFENDQNKKAIYSPQQLMSIKAKVINRKINLEKCCIYSLGILIMSYIQGMTPQQYYNYSNYVINYQAYLKSVQYIKQNYSSYLGHVLKAMTQIDPQKRINFQILKRMIKSAISTQIPKLPTDNKNMMEVKKYRNAQKISFKC